MSLLQLLETLNENDITLNVMDVAGTVIEFKAPGYEAISDALKSRTVAAITVVSTKELTITLVEENAPTAADTATDSETEG